MSMKQHPLVQLTRSSLSIWKPAISPPKRDMKSWKTRYDGASFYSKTEIYPQESHLISPQNPNSLRHYNIRHVK